MDGRAPRKRGTLGKRGLDLIHDPTLNKGTAFSPEERDQLGLRGLVPPRYSSQSDQLARVYNQYCQKTPDLEKYVYLMGLQDRNETLFYHLLIDHLEEMMPIVYTPTVGLACQRYRRIFRRPRGLTISLEDLGRVDSLLDNWPYRDIRITVVTDGERILGLGDLGLNGMGIPVGKLNLYVAAAGIDPAYTLPVCLDVGTDNADLRRDPLYLGLDRDRERGGDYDQLVDEFVLAVRKRWPLCIIQFEDFGNSNAFRLLAKYRDQVLAFNDDIQGTGAVSLAGILAALRITGQRLSDQRIVFVGAGSAGIGIAEAMLEGLQDDGLSAAEARLCIWQVDSKGLITTGRMAELSPRKQLFARDEPPSASLEGVVERVKPTVILGVAGVAGLFSEAVIRKMASHVDRPIIFALSNPTSSAECTAEQAYHWTNGKAIFASGSPFEPVTHNGRRYRPGQGNNAYIFPGLGLGALISGATRISASMFHRAALRLAELTPETQLREGSVYPRQSSIREVSIAIAEAVAKEAYRQEVTSEQEPNDLEATIRDYVWQPEYASLVP